MRKMPLFNLPLASDQRCLAGWADATTLLALGNFGNIQELSVFFAEAERDKI